MIRQRLLSLLIVVGLVHFKALSQQFLVLQPGPEVGKDAFLDSREYNRNFGDHSDLAAMAWTNLGRPVKVRSLIEFDLSQLPLNAEVIDARLSLYSYYSPRNRAHSTRDGSNRSILSLVTSPWNESTVTWETQPSTSTSSQIVLEQSDKEIQDYLGVDVLPLVIESLKKPEKKIGLMLMLEVEELYRSMLFASSDHSDPGLRPKLELRYWDGIVSDTCIILSPDSFHGKDAYIESRESARNFGGHHDLAAMAWTNLGRDVVVRGLLEFELNQIPKCARIISAHLSLFSYLSPANGSHSDRDGSNASFLKRIVSPWEEYSVTWDYQPETTDLHQVQLERSTEPIRHYENINVTTLIQDMIEEPDGSHGFMLQLSTEEKYRSLLFASSDHPNKALHPSLSVCYSDVHVIEDQCNNANDCKLTVYPNPAWVETNIYLENCVFASECKVYDVLGRFLFEKKLGKDPIIPLNVSSLTEGIYFVVFFNGKKLLQTIKLAKQGNH